MVQKVNITYQDNFDCSALDFSFPGVTIGKRITLLITKSFSDVLRTLSNQPILSLTIPESSLEDFFMHFYEGMET